MSIKKQCLVLVIALNAALGHAQDIKFEDKDRDIFTLIFKEYEPGGFAFFRESSDSVEKNRQKARTLAWNAAMDYAEKHGYLYVARPLDRSTERELRLRWQAADEMEAKGQRDNAAYEKGYMVKLNTGRVFRLKASVEETFYPETDFICLREQPSHKVVPTAFAPPSELRR